MDRARALLRLFHKLDGTLRPPPVFQSTDYTPGLPYFSHVFELCHSLLLEKRHFESATNVARVRAAVLPPLLPLRRPSAPFRFFVQRQLGLDPRRTEVVNRLCRLVPQFGIALVNRLVHANVLSEITAAEWAERQVVRVQRRDREEAVFVIVLAVQDDRVLGRAQDVLAQILNFDDAAIASYASMHNFPDFENVLATAPQET